MTDNGGANGADDLQYNRKGILMPPQSGNAWDVLTMFFAMAIPLIAFRVSALSPFPPLGLQRLAIFQVMISRNLLSDDQLRLIEFLLIILVVARFAGFPAFFSKHASKYSEQRPPPDALRRSWPGQIRLSLWIPVIGIGIDELSGIVMRHGFAPNYTMTREAFLPILILSMSLWFLTESIRAAALCSFFYFRYWRQSI
jgi:hypothetical protein